MIAENELMRLRDVGFEYLSAAREKQHAQKTRGHEGYYLALYSTVTELANRNLSAVELAAVRLLQAIALHATYDTERLPVEALYDSTISSIKNALKVLSKLTGKTISLDCSEAVAMRIFEAEKHQVNVDTGKGNHAGTEPKDKEVTAWLRETWINEDKPRGTAFFTKLKKYVNQKGSPIVEHYSAGKDAGFRWQTSAGTTGGMTKKTLLNKVSIFNNRPEQNGVNSKKQQKFPIAFPAMFPVSRLKNREKS